MVKAVDQYNGVVSLHGRIYPRPVGKFYKPRKSLSCRNWLAEDTHVDLVGTGVCAFHTSRLRVRLDDFLEPNMADIWLSKLAWEQGVPLMAIEHHSYALKYLPQKKENTIWHTQVKTQFEKQTDLLKTFLR
jgi:hypothetical protein